MSVTSKEQTTTAIQTKHVIYDIQYNELLGYEEGSADMKYMHSYCEKRTSMPNIWSFALILIGKHLAIF